MSGVMFPQATIEKAERNQFHNTGRDTIKVEQHNYNFNKEEFSDPIDYFRTIAQLVVAEVRKNNRSQSPVDETPSADGGGPPSQAVIADHTPTSSNADSDVVNICNIEPPDPSCLPVTSIADRYTRSMLKCFVGYPLYEPQPFSELSKEYLRLGINVGDVGFVRGNGRFDFLFNICPSHSGFNPPKLPEGFSLETSEHFGTESMRPLPRNTRFFQSPITRTKSGEYICGGPEGAVLELPEGAIGEEVINIRPFKELAKRYGVQWYKYTMDRGRDISNDSLYLITSFTKCTQWGLAAFDQPCSPGQGLKFEIQISLFHPRSTSKYHWKGSNPSNTKVSNLDKKDTPNQCVFLRGYKIMIRQDIFDNLCNDQPRRSGSATPSSSTQAGSSNRIKAHRIRGGGGTDPISKRLTSGSLLGRTTATTERESDHVILHANFNSSLVHPSDFINSALLSQNPGATVALTHDDVWCDLLRDNFPKPNYAKLTDIARSYMSTVDEHGCVFLEKSSSSSDHPGRRIETPAPQEPIQDVRNKSDPDIPILAHTSTALQPLSVDHSPRDGDEGKTKASIKFGDRAFDRIWGSCIRPNLATMHSLNFGDYANLQSAAGIAVGGSSAISNHNSNDLINYLGPITQHFNLVTRGDEPPAESRNSLAENRSPVTPNINLSVDHTQMAILCFQIMNSRLQQDILEVDAGPAQFMTNDKVLKQEPTKVDENISVALRHACIHWAEHLKEADRNDKRLIKISETFANKHLLHWIEALSWINKLDLADSSLEVGITFLRPTSSDSSTLLSDGRSLVSTFGDVIKQSALYTYSTALPLFPNGSLLYQTYNRKIRNNLCQVLSWGPKDSHGIITSSRQEQCVNHVVFSGPPSTLFASWSGGSVTVWDSITGMGYAKITAERVAFADNFNAGASLQQNVVYFHNFQDSSVLPIPSEASAPVLRIALSFDGRRLAAGSSDGHVKLWDGAMRTLIQDIEGFECHHQEYCQLVFSPGGTAGSRLVFSSVNDGLGFRNAIDGNPITIDKFKPTMHFNLVFSRDGSRLASLVKNNDKRLILTVWDVEKGTLMSVGTSSVGSVLAISANGSLIATGGGGHSLALWDGKSGDLLPFDAPINANPLDRISCLVFSQDDILLIGFASADNILYDVKKRSIIHKIPNHNPSAAAFSPDFTRLATGYPDGTLHLWDISSLSAFHGKNRTSTSVSILAFSPDCLRMASGSEDGTIRLWDTNCPTQLLAIHKGHSANIAALAFRVDGGSLASGAADGTIRLWDIDGNASINQFRLPKPGGLTSMAFSGFSLAVATNYETILCDIRTTETGISLHEYSSALLSFSNPHRDPSCLLASFNRDLNWIVVHNIFTGERIAEFHVNRTVEKMVFSPDNSQLAGIVRHGDGSEGCWLFDLGSNTSLRYLQANEYASLCFMPCLLQYSGESCIIMGFFAEENDQSINSNKVVVLPKGLAEDSCKRTCGPRLFALQCSDGRILLFRPNGWLL